MGELGLLPGLVEYFVRGGWWMWPLLLCSVIALAMIIYKGIALWMAGRGAGAVAEETVRLVEAGKLAQAEERTGASSASVATVLGAILAAARNTHVTPLAAAEMAGTAELANLESGLPVLSTIANIAPLIGFLGTVSGMIHAFMAVAAAGLGEPAVVAAGIAEALITTAAGLIVAIPCLIAYGILMAHVNRLALSIELAGNRVISTLAAGEAA